MKTKLSVTLDESLVTFVDSESGESRSQKIELIVRRYRDAHRDAALRRELAEELGLHDATIGAQLWNRLHIVPFLNGKFDGQREQIYEVDAPAGFEPRPMFSWEQLNAEYVFELRWWTLAELQRAHTHDGLVTAPRHLPTLLRDYLISGPPNEPLEVDP